MSKLNLEQQKTRAKELRDAVRAGDTDAIARVQRHHPQAESVPAAEVPQRFAKLSDAQLVIARELGLPSWPRLKAHVEGLEQARAAIAARAPAPDGERPTLHLRCGTDIREPLQHAGFAGEFLEFCDPYCHGPVPRDGDLPAIRARFLAEDYGAGDVAIEEKASYAALAAATRHPRIVLWFEHDSFDQLILARVLWELAQQPKRGQVEMICIDRFPAITRFVGLGQLSPEALRLLWESRTPVTAEQLRLGAAVWDALREPSPEVLHAIAAGGTPELPVMAAALRRHLQELPWTRNGLGLTQHLALEALARGPLTGRQLFARYQELEPLPFLGDGMFFYVVGELHRVARPPIEIAGTDRPWPERELSLGPTGAALLAGELDWLSLGPRERWVGGVRIAGGERGWRWSGEQDRPVL